MRVFVVLVLALVCSIALLAGALLTGLRLMAGAERGVDW